MLLPAWLVLPTLQACAFVANTHPPRVTTAAVRCRIACTTTSEFPPEFPAGLEEHPEEKPLNVDDSDAVVGATELALSGLGLAGVAAVGIASPEIDRWPFLAVASSLGLWLSAGEGMLPGGRARTSRGGAARMRVPEPDTKCYLVEGVETDGRELVVCTPQAQEFAWFHGIRVEQLSEIDTEGYLEDESVSCELEVSYNGEDEWYCR